MNEIYCLPPCTTPTMDCNNLILTSEDGSVTIIRDGSCVFDFSVPVSSNIVNPSNVYVPDIPALQAYAGASTTLVVTDTLRGGIFTLSSDVLTNDNGVIFAATGISASKHWIRQRSNSNVYLSSWYGVNGSDINVSQQTNMAAFFAAVPDKATLVIPKGDYLLDALITVTGKCFTVYAYGATFKANKLAGYNLFKFAFGDVTQGKFEWYGGTFDGNRFYQNSKASTIDPESLLTAGEKVNTIPSLGNTGILTVQNCYSATFRDVNLINTAGEGIIAFAPQKALFENCAGRNGLPISFNNNLNPLDVSQQSAYFKVRGEIGTQAEWKDCRGEGGSIFIHYSSNHAGVGSTSTITNCYCKNPMQDAIHIEHCENVFINNFSAIGDLVAGAILYRPHFQIGNETVLIIVKGLKMINGDIDANQAIAIKHASISNFYFKHDVAYYGTMITSIRNLSDGIMEGNFLTGTDGCFNIDNVQVIGNNNTVGTGFIGVHNVSNCTISGKSVGMKFSTTALASSINNTISNVSKAFQFTGVIDDVNIRDCNIKNTTFEAISTSNTVARLNIYNNYFENIATGQTANNENAIISSGLVNGANAASITFRGNTCRRNGAGTANIIYSNDTALKEVVVEDNIELDVPWIVSITPNGANSRYARNEGYFNFDYPHLTAFAFGGRRLGTANWYNRNNQLMFKSADQAMNNSFSLPLFAPLNDLDGITLTDVVGTGSVVPTANQYSFGNIIKNTVLTPGSNWGWLQITEGQYIAQLWLPSTVFRKNSIVSNGVNVYKCMTSGGTTAASGGPSGTGTGIVDGTTTWDFFGTVAPYAQATAWAPSTLINLSMAGPVRRSNGGNVYELLTAGTTAASGGPSGTGYGIVDGSATWRYVGPLAVWQVIGTIGAISSSVQSALDLKLNISNTRSGRVTTGSIGATSTALVTLTWSTAFADTNYTVNVGVQDATTSGLSLRVVHIESKTTTNITVRVENTSAGALTGTLNAIAIHD